MAPWVSSAVFGARRDRSATSSRGMWRMPQRFRAGPGARCDSSSMASPMRSTNRDTPCRAWTRQSDSLGAGVGGWQSCRGVQRRRSTEPWVLLPWITFLTENRTTRRAVSYVIHPPPARPGENLEAGWAPNRWALTSRPSLRFRSGRATCGRSHRARTPAAR